MSYKGFYDTDTVSKFLGISSIGKIWIDTSKDEKVKGYGMIHNQPHTEEAKQKMRESGKPSLHKGGTVVSPEGKIVEFSCLSHFCKENNLSSGHICELLQGKRKSVKGWKNGTSVQ